MAEDPVTSNPGHYRVVLENDRVRVLEYTDEPGDRTVAHRHPDSVMVTLTGFDRRLGQGERTLDVTLEADQVRWLGAQEHWGENTGTTPTRCVFVELKETPLVTSPAPAALGPTR